MCSFSLYHAQSLVSVVCSFSLCNVQPQDVFSLSYMQYSACVMCSLESVLCAAFSVSGSTLKRLVASLLIPADRYTHSRHTYINVHIYRTIWIYIYIYICVFI